MEWTVVTVVIARVGLGAAIIKPIVSLNTAITKLTVVVGQLQDNIESLTSRNSESHDRLFKRLDEQGETINDHETRITVLERHKGE